MQDSEVIILARAVAASGLFENHCGIAEAPKINDRLNRRAACGGTR